MRVKKYPQSHLIVSKDFSKIIIDPGMITFKKGFKPEEFKDAQAYLITHQHPDHMDPENIKAVVGKIPVYGNSDVVAKLKELGIEATEVHDRHKFKIAGFEIEPVDLPHCKMEDGTDGPPNTGFLIDGVLFHPGDGDEVPHHVTSDNLALPIAGPTITLAGALKFAQDVKAKVVIPIHNDYFHNDPEKFLEMAKPHGIDVRILNPGESTEI